MCASTQPTNQSLHIPPQGRSRLPWGACTPSGGEDCRCGQGQGQGWDGSPWLTLVWTETLACAGRCWRAVVICIRKGLRGLLLGGLSGRTLCRTENTWRMGLQRYRSRSSSRDSLPREEQCPWVGSRGRRADLPAITASNPGQQAVAPALPQRFVFEAGAHLPVLLPLTARLPAVHRDSVGALANARAPGNRFLFVQQWGIF